jgi:hypothetical protein
VKEIRGDGVNSQFPRNQLPRPLRPTLALGVGRWELGFRFYFPSSL